MITCKDCKLAKKCKCEHKHFEISEDGDSYARYCDDFETNHKTHTVRIGNFKASQNNYGGIWVWDCKTKQMRMHAQSVKFLSRKELKEYLRFFIKTLPDFERNFDKIFADEEGEENV